VSFLLATGHCSKSLFNAILVETRVMIEYLSSNYLRVCVYSNSCVLVFDVAAAATDADDNVVTTTFYTKSTAEFSCCV